MGDVDNNRLIGCAWALVAMQRATPRHGKSIQAPGKDKSEFSFKALREIKPKPMLVLRSATVGVRKT